MDPLTRFIISSLLIILFAIGIYSLAVYMINKKCDKK